METVLIVSAMGLMAQQYMKQRQAEIIVEDIIEEEELGAPPMATRGVDRAEAQKTISVAHARPPPREDAPLGRAPILDGVVTSIAPTRTQVSTDNFGDQFYPQETKATIPKKSWMSVVDTPYRPKEEGVNDAPVREDRNDLKMSDLVRERNTSLVQRTVKPTSEKQFESPVSSEWTGGGTRNGFHPLGMNQNYKFLLNEDERLQPGPGPRGNFAPGSKAAPVVDIEYVEKGSTLDIFSQGPPTASVQKKGIPEPSFKLLPSNAESYDMSNFSRAAGNAPVEAGVVKPSFKVSSEEDINTFGVGFKTGTQKVERANPTSDRPQSDVTNKNYSLPPVGIAGGTRGASVPGQIKESDVRNKSKLLDSSGLTAGVGRGGGSTSVFKSELTPADLTLSEEIALDPAPRAFASNTKKPVSKEQVAILTNSREEIDANTERKPILAATNDKLPYHLRIRPTGSVTSGNVSMTLKTDRGEKTQRIFASNRLADNGPTPGVENISTQGRKLGTILNDRMNSTADIVKFLGNPYLKPAAKAIKY